MASVRNTFDKTDHVKPVEEASLTDEQVDAIAQVLLLTQRPSQSALDQLGLADSVHHVEEKLWRYGLDVCAGCGTWSFDIEYEYCVDCRGFD